MPHVCMAAREWRTEECEQLVRLYENLSCLYNITSKDYKDKNNRMVACYDNNCSDIQSDIFFFVLSILLCKQHFALKVG